MEKIVRGRAREGRVRVVATRSGESEGTIEYVSEGMRALMYTAARRGALEQGWGRMRCQCTERSEGWEVIVAGHSCMHRMSH